MKSWMKKLGALCLTAALATCTLTACVSDHYYELELVSKPTLTVRGFDEETGLYTVFVEGLAHNTTGMMLSSASAWVSFYDEFGDPIEPYGYAYVEGMDVDEVWHYYVLAELEIAPTDYEVIVDGYDY